jgi:uncharacterized protein
VGTLPSSTALSSTTVVVSSMRDGAATVQTESVGARRSVAEKREARWLDPFEESAHCLWALWLELLERTGQDVREMDFLIYSRAATSAVDADDDRALDERHWSYMDRFSDSMIARGPTLAPDRETFTGSMHVLSLPDADAARRFVAEEPYNRAGLYEQHSVWLFDNLLGRTMWEVQREASGPRFLVIAAVDDEVAGSPPPVPAADLSATLRDRLILYGALRAVEGGAIVGIVLAVQAPTRAAVDSLAREAIAPSDERSRAVVHDWEFGGRR